MTRGTHSRTMPGAFSGRAPIALFLLACVFTALYTFPAAAALRYTGDRTYTYHQPDGSTFPVTLYGNDFYAYAETADGRVVVRDDTTNFWCYANLSADGRSFESTGIPVVTQAKSQGEGASQAVQAGIPAKLRLPADVVMDKVHAAQQRLGVDEKGRPVKPSAAKSGSGTPLAAPPASTTTGSRVGLCLLVDFSDQTGTIPKASIEAFFNQVSPRYTSYGNACSVREYFQVQSGGLLDYTNVVTAYVRMSHPKTYYDDNTDTGKAQELVSEALDKLVLQGFDFTQLSVDGGNYITCINVLYAGTCSSDWSKGLWPHCGGIAPKLVDSTNDIYAYAYEMTDIGSSLSIGTVCHENGHLLCWFPDLYPYDDNPAFIGYYSLMDIGCYGDDSCHPTNIDPYLKAAAGWATVEDISLESCSTASMTATDNTFYRYRNPERPTEYFMFEVRANTGYEAAFGGSSVRVNPGSGVVAYHVLEGGSNTYSTIRNVTSPDYSVPYELMLIESHPYANGTRPWHLVPDPGSNDAFSAEGVDALDADTTPELRFWASDGRTTESLLRIYSVSSAAASMTFDAGRPEGEFVVEISPAAAATAGAQWSLDNATWYDSGESPGEIADGAYTISFSQPAGWVKPADQTITVGGGCGTAIVGAYTESAISLPVALNAPTLTWSTTGNALWFGEPSVSHDSHAAAQSGNIGGGEYSTLAVTVTGPGTLTFWWKVSSEANYDFFDFSVDGSAVSEISGQPGWAYVSRSVTSGSHTFRWIYSKDEYGDSGQDAGWVDEVVYTPQSVSTGSLLVTINPATPVTEGAQWQLDGGAWNDSGTTLTSLATGTYTIAFNAVSGWRKPADQEVTVTSGAMTHLVGTYTQGSAVTVTIEPSDAVSHGAQWRLDGGTWHDSGYAQVEISTGQHTITFSEVFGFETPTPQIVNVSSDSDLELTGEYTPWTDLPAFGSPIVFLALMGAIAWFSWRRFKALARQ